MKVLVGRNMEKTVSTLCIVEIFLKKMALN